MATDLPQPIAEFRAVLDRAGYTYTTDGEKTDVIYKRYVDLPSLTTLPEGVTFSNGGGVDLRSLTTLPEGVTFSNGGGVYLPSLTTLPEGVTFSNGGYVYLRSLTTLPEGVTFSNGGDVYLRSLTTLPEGVTFSNGGYVYLRSLESEEQSYQGRTIRLRQVDDYTMLICSERKRGGVTISRARYFGGGDIDQLRECYIASEGDYHAHGASIDEALRDLRFKAAAENFDPSDTIAEIIRTGVVERNQFRLLTGACDEGLRAGLEQAGLAGDADKLPLDVALKAAHGGYGLRFKAMIAEARAA
jgi:hypothetical protein